jgi:AcrR family transcriptional regulator
LVTNPSVRTRIVQAAAGLLADSADADISTRAVCEAAGVTAPTLYHHFGDKEGLLAAVVEFGWASFLDSKRVVAAVVHPHVADDIRAGWDNHMEFARENPNFYKLMWSPGVAASSTAFRDAYQLLYERMQLGARRGQLGVSAERAAQMVMAATTGAAMSAISQPGMYGDVSFATQLREAVIASVTVPPGTPTTSSRRVGHESGPSLATAAATLMGQLATEDTPLTRPEQALLQQWLTTLADTPAPQPPTPKRGSPGGTRPR